MTETVKKRCRWPWVIGTVALALIGGPIAWEFRPLSATEKRLVGDWYDPIQPEAGIRFYGDRRYEAIEMLDPPPTYVNTVVRGVPVQSEAMPSSGDRKIRSVTKGSWHAEGNQVTRSPDVELMSQVWNRLHGAGPRAMNVQFAGLEMMIHHRVYRRSPE